jgi:hypothetical protein
MQHARAPVVAGSELHFGRPDGARLPVIQFMHAMESQIVHEISDIKGDDDRLLFRHGTKGFAVEMIEVGVRDQHEVNVRKIVDLQPRHFHALHDLQPVRPVRVDQHVEAACPDQKRRVSNPSDANLPFTKF